MTKLLIRTMRDKYGSRQHVVYTDKSGIAEPLGIFDDTAIREFIDMYYAEQQSIDRLVTGDK